MATTYVRLTTAGTGFQLANTSYGIPSAQRKTHIDPKVWYVRGELSPFLTLARAGRFGYKKVTDPKFTQFEQPEKTTTFKMTATCSTATNTLTLTIDASGPLRVGDRAMPLDGSGQIARVTAINSATQINVTWYTANGTPTTTITTVADNTYFQNLGNSVKEGSTLPHILQAQVAARTNYTETMRYPFGGTRHRLRSQLWTGRGKEYLARNEWLVAKKDIEYKFMWGVPTEQVITSTVYRTTGGLWYWITKQSGFSHDYTSVTFTIVTFLNDLQSVFSYGSSRKMLIANYALLGILDRMKGNKLQMRPMENNYNLKVNMIETNYGELEVMPSLALEMPNSYGTGTMKAMGFIVDPQFIDYVYFDEDIHIEYNKQAPDYDGMVDEYIGDVGISVNVSQAHGVLYDISAIDVTAS